MLIVTQRAAPPSAAELVYSREWQRGVTEMNNGCCLQHLLTVISGKPAT